MLSHAASAMGVVAAENAMGQDRRFPFHLVPRGLWTVPEIGSVGLSSWMPAKVAAERLKKAGIDKAQGFALNTSNYRATDELIAYGKEISAMVGGKHFVIDTSRNGNGPLELPEGEDAGEKAWCNPPGRALGSPPTTQTADPLCDAYLWLKKPGESDGECNGGPKAGEWWQEQALELARNAKF